jgi:hypothetical protein
MSPTLSLSLASLAALVLPGTDGQPRSEPEVLALTGVPTERVELSANTFTWSSQDAVAVAQDAHGRTVAVWQSRRQQDGNYGVYARLFGPSGQPLTDEVEVNQYTRGPQTLPTVAMDGQGAVWIAWESLGQDGDAGGIFARRFDAALETATVEVLVNEATAGHQAEVALACDEAGNALVAWTSPEGDQGGRAVLARRLGPDGRPVGGAFRVGGGERATLPAVAPHPDGTWTVAWSRHALSGEPQAILARRLEADGAPRGAVHAVFEREGQQPVEPVICATAEGGLVAAWLVAESEDYVPHAARLAWDAEAQGWTAGPVQRFPEQGRGYTSGLDVAALDGGDYVLAWTRFVDSREAELRARRVAADGSVGQPVVLSRARQGDQRLAVGGGARRLVAGADGRLAVAWHGDAGLGDGSAANLTLLIPEGSAGEALAFAPTLRFQPDQGAVPHEPPIDSGGAMRREDFLGTKSLSGPDFGFLGITQTSLTPPDPHVAVGPGHAVEIVNGAIAWFERDGTFQFQQPIDGGGGFWVPAGANGFIFDPEVVFDPLTRRFFAMANERGSGKAFFLLAVSDDEDPNGTWYKYRFDVTAAAGDTDIDSPNMGMDAQAVYLTADFFGPDKYLIYIVEKAPLLSGGTPQTRSLLNTGSQSWGIPVMYTAAPRYYMIQAFEGSSSSSVRLHAIDDPLGTPSLTSVDLSVPTYTYPEDPPQQGTSSRPELFEPRFWSCVFRNGKLYATHHQGGSRALQRWYEIDMGGWPVSGTPSLVQWGNVDPGGDIRTFFGSIGVDGLGNVALTYARSSPSELISMARGWHEVGDPAGSTTPSVIMKQSTIPDTTGRWGDYSATVADPDFDRVFWGVHEYRTGGWATWIGVYGPCETPVSYCTAKTNSLGQTATMGSIGEPSLGTDAFSITLSGGVPGSFAVFFYGDTPDNSPLYNGFLCVGGQLLRTPAQVIAGDGTLSLSVPITESLIGRKRYFQCWYRDPNNSDGTGVGLSDGLEVTFCP